MIRFSASLVVVAVGILVAGGVTSKLLLVYIAIALSAVALVFLLIGAFLDRDELHAGAEDAPAGAGERADAGRAPDLARSDEAGVAAVAAGTRTAGEDKAPAGDSPAGDRSADDRPAGDRPAGDRPVGEPAGDRPVGERSAGDPAAADLAVGGGRDDAGNRDDAGGRADAAHAGTAGSDSPGGSPGAGRALDREGPETFAYRDELVYRKSTGFQSPEWPGRPGGYPGHGPQTSQDRSPGQPRVSPEPVQGRPADPTGARPEDRPAACC